MIRLALALASALLVPPPSEVGAAGSVDGWTAAERDVLRSLSIDSLPPLPPSPANPHADDPRAVALGHRLFFDPRLSVDGTVSCARCHRPERNFTDGLPRARALGETARRTMTLVGAAWSPWHFWDGRRDSLWSQALEPLEHRDEHGGTRLLYARLLLDEDYRSEHEALFGPLPDLSDTARFPLAASPTGSAAERAAWKGMAEEDRQAVSRVFADTGRALEAYERRLAPGAAPFDDYVRAVLAGDAAAASDAMSEEQVHGLRLFIGKAQCIHCHNGPLFTNNEFHNTGLFGPDTLPTDRGRIEGVKILQADPFNCLASVDASAREAGACDELRFVKDQGVELVAAFRTPPLRNVAGNGPYMHTGQFATLEEVIDHYDAARPTLISDELEPLGLTPQEKARLVDFLHALDGPLDVDPALLEPPRKSGD